jgi:hypothetical protein
MQDGIETEANSLFHTPVADVSYSIRCNLLDPSIGIF